MTGRGQRHVKKLNHVLPVEVVSDVDVVKGFFSKVVSQI